MLVVDGEERRSVLRAGDSRGGGFRDSSDYRTQVLRELDQIREDISKINRRLDDGLLDRITRLEEGFIPVKRLVWGLVTIILTAVMLGMLSLVMVSGALRMPH